MFIENKVERPWYGYSGLRKNFETGATFTRISPERKFVKILIQCITYQTSRDIYPNTKAPLMHQMRDMCRAGLLQRYTNDEDKKFRYYYKTTQKGKDVIRQAYNNPNLDVERLCVMTKYHSQDSSYFKEINLNVKKNLVEAYALFDPKINKVYVGNISEFKRLDELTFNDIKDFISNKDDAQKLFKLFGTLPRFHNCELRKFTFSIV